MHASGFAHVVRFTPVLYCSSTVSVCSNTVPVLHQYCSSTISVLSQYCSNTIAAPVSLQLVLLQLPGLGGNSVGKVSHSVRRNEICFEMASHVPASGFAHLVCLTLALHQYCYYCSNTLPALHSSTFQSSSTTPVQYNTSCCTSITPVLLQYC